jgi:hypothetical protein
MGKHLFPQIYHFLIVKTFFSNSLKPPVRYQQTPHSAIASQNSLLPSNYNLVHTHPPFPISPSPPFPISPSPPWLHPYLFFAGGPESSRLLQSLGEGLSRQVEKAKLTSRMLKPSSACTVYFPALLTRDAVAEDDSTPRSNCRTCAQTASPHPASPGL